MLKDLIKLANHLDQKGLRAEADYLDGVIRKWASDVSTFGYNEGPAGNLSEEEISTITRPAASLRGAYTAEKKEEAINKFETNLIILLSMPELAGDINEEVLNKIKSLSYEWAEHLQSEIDSSYSVTGATKAWLNQKVNWVKKMMDEADTKETALTDMGNFIL